MAELLRKLTGDLRKNGKKRAAKSGGNRLLWQRFWPQEGAKDQASPEERLHEAAE